jgi:hypothetical protein
MPIPCLNPANDRCLNPTHGVLHILLARWKKLTLQRQLKVPFASLQSGPSANLWAVTPPLSKALGPVLPCMVRVSSSLVSKRGPLHDLG